MNNNTGVLKKSLILENIGKAIYIFIKNVFNLICAILGCIALIPVAIIVKIIYILNDDSAPIFYTQKRIGKDGKEFNLYKFRTMVVNADEVLSEILKNDAELAKEYAENKKLKNDPRITKAGKFLRKLSLDELPQFLNVLKFEMSIIGNRPYLPREKEDMGEYYDDIIKTRPGITGYWQVNGRSAVSFKQRLELESYYSKNCSLIMDIKIFFKTFIVAFKGM